MSEKKQYSALLIGHIDAGKSTLGGQILSTLKMVPEETINLYKQLSKDNKKESWYLSYLMDTSEEERKKGKTFEYNRVQIKIPTSHNTNKCIMLIDSPGHRNYVSEMLAAASTADVSIIVVSARGTEFESGFDRDGQTREHLLLSCCMNIKKLIVCINKIDTVEESQREKRISIIKKTLIKFVKPLYENIEIISISAQQCINITDPTIDERVRMSRLSKMGNINADLSNLSISNNANSLLSILSRIEVKDSGVFCATVLDTHKNSSDIYINSGSNTSPALYFISADLLPFTESIKFFKGKEVEDSSFPHSSEDMKFLKEFFFTQQFKLSPLKDIRDCNDVERDSLQSGNYYTIKQPLPKSSLIVDGDFNLKEISMGNTFYISVSILFNPSNPTPYKIISAGYICVMHISTNVVDIAIKELIDPKTRKKLRFISPANAKGRFILKCQRLCISGILINRNSRCALRLNDLTIAIGTIKTHRFENL